MPPPRPARVTIADLPDDLLAHVLRFTTLSARRDSQPAPAPPLSVFRYAAVSTAFRRALLHGLTSLTLASSAAATYLASRHWHPLPLCRSLRCIHVPRDAGLTDAQLIALFRRLDAAGIRLRQLDLSLDRSCTHLSALCFAELFGVCATSLRLNVLWNGRMRRRSLHELLAPTAPAINSPFGAGTVAHEVVDGAPLPSAQAAVNTTAGPAAITTAGSATGPDNSQGGNLVQLSLTHAPLQAGGVAAGVMSPFPGPGHEADEAEEGEEGEEEAMAGIAEAGHGGGNDDALMAEHQEEQLLVEDVINQGEQDLMEQEGDGQELAPATQAANIVNQLPNILHILEGNMGAQQLLLAPHGNYEGLLNPAQLPHHQPGPRAYWCHVLSGKVLEIILERMPLLQHFALDGAHHLRRPGIMPISKCVELRSLVLTGKPHITSQMLMPLFATLTKLQHLRLGYMPLVGDTAISAMCNGPAKRTLEALELNKLGLITDLAVRQLVNSCQVLHSVHISDCPHITCEAASHLSCALRLQDIFFKPHVEHPLTDRTSIHISCASSTLRSVQLVGCKLLGLDGIGALRNLPALQKLHLRGLGHVSQDVMRQLGMFPKLDELLLKGSMDLTDLGVKVLCGQRGHRFLHLSLLDYSMNLSDDALDFIMTWCVSLRTLKVRGDFNPGAIERLRESISNAELTVYSKAEGRRFSPTCKGVWDPVLLAE